MKTTTCSEFRGYRINTGVHSKLSCNIASLNQIIDSIEYMVHEHSKVMCVRIDIINDNNGYTVLERHHITRVLEETKRHLESKLRGSKNALSFHYIWTTEQTEDAKHPHYHFFILVNGNAIQNGYSIKEALTRYVMRWLKTDKRGLVHFSESNGLRGMMLDRNAPDFEDQKNAAVYAASYLAKVSTKERRPKGARFSSASRFPRFGAFQL